MPVRLLLDSRWWRCFWVRPNFNLGAVLLDLTSAAWCYSKRICWSDWTCVFEFSWRLTYWSGIVSRKTSRRSTTARSISGRWSRLRCSVQCRWVVEWTLTPTCHRGVRPTAAPARVGAALASAIVTISSVSDAGSEPEQFLISHRHLWNSCLILTERFTTPGNIV